LRANVMSRIAAEKKTARCAWRYVFAFGAIASVALVAFLSWPSNRAIHNSPITDQKIANSPLVDSSLNPTSAVNPASPLPSVARTASADDSGRLAFTTDADQAGMSVPALEHPELMTVKPLFEGAPVKAIDAIEPIRLAPLVVPAIGDDNQ
jgi:hypothetical protein